MSDQLVRISLSPALGVPCWRVQVDCSAVIMFRADRYTIWKIFELLPTIVWEGYENYMRQIAPTSPATP